MKKMLIVFAVGILVGAIIATGGVCVYAAVRNSNAKSEKASTTQVGGMPAMNNDNFGNIPGSGNGENNGNSQIPQLPNGQNGNSGQGGQGEQNGSFSQFPGTPGEQNGQNGGNSQTPQLPGNGTQSNQN